MLKRYEDDGRPEADLPLVEWGAKHCIYQTQVALDQILRNFPNKWVGIILRGVIFPLGRRFRTPNDRLGRKVAKLLLQPGESRDRLTHGIYNNEDADDVTGCLEVAMKLVIDADEVEKMLRDKGHRKPDTVDYDTWVAELLGDGQVTGEQADLLRQSWAATYKVIMVDDFPNDFLQAAVPGKNTDSQLAAAV